MLLVAEDVLLDTDEVLLEAEDILREAEDDFVETDEEERDSPEPDRRTCAFISKDAVARLKASTAIIDDRYLFIAKSN